VNILTLLFSKLATDKKSPQGLKQTVLALSEKVYSSSPVIRSYTT